MIDSSGRLKRSIRRDFSRDDQTELFSTATFSSVGVLGSVFGLGRTVGDGDWEAGKFRLKFWIQFRWRSRRSFSQDWTPKTAQNEGDCGEKLSLIFHGKCYLICL